MIWRHLRPIVLRFVDSYLLCLFFSSLFSLKPSLRLSNSDLSSYPEKSQHLFHCSTQAPVPMVFSASLVVAAPALLPFLPWVSFPVVLKDCGARLPDCPFLLCCERASPSRLFSALTCLSLGFHDTSLCFSLCPLCPVVSS